MDNFGKPKVLIVDDEEVLRNILSRFINKAGYETLEAKDGKEAIELYKISKPFIVISDIMMPKMDGLTLLNELKKIDKNAMVALMTGYGNEDILLEALRGGALNFFKKPFNFQEIVNFVRNALKRRSEPEYNELYSEHLVEESKKFVFPTGETNILPIINQVTLHLKKIADTSEILNLKIGIEEMIANAIEHGNLGITMKEKHKALEEGIWGKFIQHRLDINNNRSKKVLINSYLGTKYFAISIEDEGNGFDWKSLPALSPDNLLNYNGRGIFLTKIYYNEVIFNQKGNIVTLKKYTKHIKN